MFYGECYKCGERWELGTASTCKCEVGMTFDASAPVTITSHPYFYKRDLTCVCGAVWDGEQMVHAPRHREWQGLTEPELHQINPTWPAPGQHWDYEDVLAFARAIEAKLKEKNT
jgi:hypothetical protein